MALFLGGVLGLLINGPMLIALRNRLGRAPRLSPLVVAVPGAAFGVISYCAGLVLLGRGDELAHGASAFLDDPGVPWALLVALASGGTITFLSARSSWHPAGSFMILSLMLTLAGWIGFLLTERLPLAILQGSIVQVGWIGFIVTQIFAAALLFVYAHYSIDALTRRRWRRASTQIKNDPELRPKVALHVPTFNEDPELVATTLDSLVQQDYPQQRVMVIVADDSTDSEKVERMHRVCKARGVKFIHRDERTGFKAGALNEALRQTPPDYELIGVIDADFQVDPAFLRENVGFFTDPRITFVQTPQEISNLDDSWVSRYAGIGQRFFYQTAMHTRNEHEASMFCGSMGLLRRSALEDVGGWTDGHISEDADLSIRLEHAGHSSVYVGHKTYGRGLVPNRGESYRIQQARWANGGARLLRDHTRSITTGPMTLKQKAHHLTSSLFWFDGTLALIFAFTTSVLALMFLTGQLGDMLHVPEIAFVAILPLIIIADSTLRLAFVAKRRLDAAARDVFGLLMVWWSVKLVTATEAWSGLFGSTKPFQSTPKTTTERLPRGKAALQALRAAPIESAIAVWLALLAIAVAVKLVVVGASAPQAALFAAVVFVLSFYTVYFAAAWLTVYLGHTTRQQQKPTPIQTVRPSPSPRAGPPAEPQGAEVDPPASTGPESPPVPSPASETARAPAPSRPTSTKPP